MSTFFLSDSIFGSASALIPIPVIKWSKWPLDLVQQKFAVDVRKSTDRFCPLIFWNTEMFTSQRYVRINPCTHVHSEKPKTRYIRNPLWHWSGLGKNDPSHSSPIKFPFWELDFSCLLFLCKKDQYLVANKYQLVILTNWKAACFDPRANLRTQFTSAYRLKWHWTKCPEPPRASWEL